MTTFMKLIIFTFCRESVQLCGNFGACGMWDVTFLSHIVLHLMVLILLYISTCITPDSGRVCLKFKEPGWEITSWQMRLNLKHQYMSLKRKEKLLSYLSMEHSTKSNSINFLFCTIIYILDHSHLCSPKFTSYLFTALSGLNYTSKWL